MDQPIAAQPSDGAPVVSATPAHAALDPGSIPEI
jgi:hypothetical protein